MNPNQHPSAPLETSAAKTKHRTGRLSWILLGIGMLTGLLAVGIVPRLNRQTELDAALLKTKELPTVNVVKAQRSPAATDSVLPGSVQAIQETTIYARTNGYLKRRLVDIGDRVQAGQLLAEIDSPETDQELQQARADLASFQAALVEARANLELASQSWQRWQALVSQGAESRQAADERRAAFNTSKANVSAAMADVNSRRANVQRLVVLQSFKQVTAPFSGIITARNVNSGALIAAGSSTDDATNTTGNSGLFRIARTDILRIRVSVPQTLVKSIQVGQTAQIQLRELPQPFTGRIVRTADSLDPTSNTLVTEIEVRNQDDALRPGMYTSVKFTTTRANPPLLVPANTLVINANGIQVATVRENQTVHYQKIEVGRDYGTEVEITSGLGGQESLIANPTYNIQEGTRVQAVAVKQQQN